MAKDVGQVCYVFIGYFTSFENCLLISFVHSWIGQFEGGC